jgi:outer membrane protein OmpA-like peptidoglycan-associated protein
MPHHPTDRWRGAALAAVLGGGALMATADFARAQQQPTRDEIIESLRAKQLTRCPRLDATAGCGAVQPAAIDVEVQFGRGSAMLGAAAVSRLETLGADLAKPELKGATLLVAGHADASGGDAYNQRLSQRRAGAVKRFLVGRFKLPDETVIAVGQGRTQPKNPADPFAGENRRVRIALLPPGSKPDAAPDRR